LKERVIPVLKALQHYNIQRIASCGGIAMVVTPHNFEASMKFFEASMKFFEASMKFLENVAKEHAKYGSKNPVYQ
jgi:hypothetical protein